MSYWEAYRLVTRDPLTQLTGAIIFIGLILFLGLYWWDNKND
jgi:hypothetical protein